MNEKYKRIGIVLIIVVGLHLVFLAGIKFGSSGKTTNDVSEVKDDVEKGEVFEPPQGPVEEIADVPDAVDDQPAAPVATDPLANVQTFSQNYFVSGVKALPANIQKMAEGCKSGVVVDLSNRKVLWERDAYTARPMASVTKIMTAIVAVRKMRLSKGVVTPDTMIRVTREASKIGGRQVWLDPKESFTFTELMKCIMVHSANDCAYLMAEFMGNGDVTSFIGEMNGQAQALGCKNFKFYNSHGLTDESGAENSGSPMELAYLASVALKIPEITRWTNVRTEYLRENDEAFKARNKGQATMLSSSNHVLGKCNGVNGMKTGFTNKAGFCIVITCERNSREMAVVLMGCKDAKSRDALGIQLVNWAYQN